MKTILLVNSSSARYFRRDHGIWRLIDKPEHKDKLWVIADLPEETLEAFKLPLLFGRDRSNYLERRLVAAFAHSQYRAAPIISGSLFKPGTAVLTGLTTAEAVTSRLVKLDIPIAGVWGMAMLLTLMLKRLSINDVVLAMPGAHYLRILVVKDGIPMLTRCVRRYSEDSDNDSDANEILRTRQHLENRRIFEHNAIPPVLYLGDATSIGAHLTSAGLNLLPLPESLSPEGDAGYLHPLFEHIVSSPRGQLAPLQLRARHLAENLRRAAYAGCALSLLAAALFGQEDFRALIDLHGREKTLLADLQKARSERERIAGDINATGFDPALVRQATQFAAMEIDAAPTPASILQIAANTIADLPQVRIKSLDYRFPKQGERYCQGHSVIDLPYLSSSKPAIEKLSKSLSPGGADLALLGGSKPRDSGVDDATGIPLRHAELQFTILLPGNLTVDAQKEIRKRISAALKAQNGIQLMLDPVAITLINTLKGGFGKDPTGAENLWCMSIPWNNSPSKDMP